ncbi:hypothetical protein CTI12_AA224580 [Artemisia annua]|uniref:Uncharacterized protein n=1 Tax=Artemisia annua TaxID=35608 RepID=A0A2U1NVC5_ARTAN|nr:hypothetical protein CTI12_AA224580 [Artemisia annua]
MSQNSECSSQKTLKAVALSGVLHLDESLISDPRKQKWVDEISKILTHQLTIPFELIPKPSIFQVPEKLAAEKPEAYEPQHIGLGSNHHFRPQPYKRMEQKKLTVVQSVLQDRQINDFKVVIEKIRKLVPLIRACYDMSLQDDDDTLAWVFAIDGVFLFEVIRKYNNDGIFHFPSIQDILMMENQIPFGVLKEIDDALMQPSSGTSTDLHYIFLQSKFQYFSLTHSPLDLCDISVAPTNAKHLLDYMYQSIIKKAPLALVVPQMGVPKIMTQTAEGGVADVFNKVSDFTNQIPKDEIVHIYKETLTILETFSQSKSPIPSASEYLQRDGIRFCNLNSDQGIKNIYIDGEKFVLPSLTLNKDVEVVIAPLLSTKPALLLLAEHEGKFSHEKTCKLVATGFKGYWWFRRTFMENYRVHYQHCNSNPINVASGAAT